MLFTTYRPGVAGGAARMAAVSLFAACLLISACVAPGDAGLADSDADLRSARVNDSLRQSVSPGALRSFEFDVPIGGALDVTALAADGAVAHLSSVRSPDGRMWNAQNPRRAPFSTEDASEPFGEGFRIRSAQVGSWQIVVGVVRPDELAQLTREREARSAVENLALLIYVLSGAGSGADDALGNWLRSAFPSLDGAARAAELLVRINQGGSDGDDGSDGGDDNSNQNGGDNGNSNGNSNGNTNGGNSNGGGNGNSNSGGNGNSNSGGGNSNSGPAPTQVRLSAIARSGDPVPGQPATAKFTHFGNPLLDNDGRIAFWAKYSGGNGDGGLFYWDGTELVAIVSDDPASRGSVPGSDGNAFFGDVNVRFDSGAPGITWGRDGRLLFLSPVQSPFPIGVFRYRVGDGDLLRVADMRQLATFFTDALPNTFSAELFAPAISDAGIAAFATRYTFIREGPEFVSGRTGVFTSNGVSLTTVADNQLSPAGRVPDQPATATFDVLDSRISMSREGVLLFQSTYRRGNGNRGVYLLANGEIVRVLDNATGRSFPGVPIGAQVNGVNNPFDAIAVGEGARIAVDTTLTVNGQTRSAVLLWNGQRWRELTSLGGQPSTDLLSGVDDSGQVLFLADGRPHLARGSSNQDLTTVVAGALLGGRVRWSEAAGGLNNRGRGLLRYQRTEADGTTVISDGLAFWSGERMLVAADPSVDNVLREFNRVFTVTRPEQNRVGRSGVINDRDEFVFRAATTGADVTPDTNDDIQAIFLGTAFSQFAVE
ncbi:MAG: hypothetical protein HRU75_09110 [Planctomycetia bacterium]|nr:MAG: hypothetical protein HRU75_09110 [Planctomycetia bacterium]